MITEQDLTIYHNNNGVWELYHEKGTIRNEEQLTRDNNGVSKNDTSIIRLFNVGGFGNSYKVDLGDVIVSEHTNYQIVKAPITELRKIYGKENVYEVASVTKNIFEDAPLSLKHIKIGAR